MSSSNRATKQKRAIWSALEDAHRPLSPVEVFQSASRTLPSLSLATVYRIIRGFIEEQRVVAVSLPGAPDRYETKGCAEHHHHHFLCDGCGKVFDVPGCGFKLETELPAGFSVKRHEVVLYGDCKECQAARSA
jgi:Fur family ferric uptake transcriptional regulator